MKHIGGGMFVEYITWVKEQVIVQSSDSLEEGLISLLGSQY